ncbi:MULTISPECIES: hypothetical protein [Actinoalloteichus]|uniref:Uncharacterized protein n=1 Tax=Actinoalloteichus fjordicus TaxID=1612552 RepID=A0AAC9LHY2_9PSEU|nr:MULTISPECIES: hypothetical protein [Actinoalloteichus]APU17087.1 hypothetical protein UA74_25390 [Actinoalloteichus fjordicus]APU23168.1 hypothetical protein UA75_25975 [Actinoalloteichus sp. GBA129-24]
MRIGYVLHECFKSSSGAREWDRLLGVQVVVDLDPQNLERAKEKLAPWALGVLAEHRCDFGLFEAQLAVLDEEDEPGRYFRHCYLIGAGAGAKAVQLEDSPSEPAEILRLAYEDEAVERDLTAQAALLDKAG